MLKIQTDRSEAIIWGRDAHCPEVLLLPWKRISHTSKCELFRDFFSLSEPPSNHSSFCARQTRPCFGVEKAATKEETVTPALYLSLFLSPLYVYLFVFLCLFDSLSSLYLSLALSLSLSLCIPKVQHQEWIPFLGKRAWLFRLAQLQLCKTTSKMKLLLTCLVGMFCWRSSCWVSFPQSAHRVVPVYSLSSA